MGNVTEALQDLTEQGNTWKDGPVQVPDPSEVLDRRALERTFIAPTLVLPHLRGVDQGRTGLSKALSSTPTTTSPRSPLDDSADEEVPLDTKGVDSNLPVFMVLKPGCADDPKELRKDARLRAYWKRLDLCPELENRLLLTVDRFESLLPHLPLTARFAPSWKLLYSPLLHGVSLGTFYRHCRAWPGETLLIVEDTNGTVFGGFASHTWQTTGRQLYYGSPECFVFTSGPPLSRRIEVAAEVGTATLGLVFTNQSLACGRVEVKRVCSDSLAEKAGVLPGDVLIRLNGAVVSSIDKMELERRLHCERPLDLTFLRGEELTVFPWAGGNQLFMFADEVGFSMGGGGSFAFWIGKDILRGTSAANSTFGTTAPLSSAPDFVIQHFECWVVDREPGRDSLDASRGGAPAGTSADRSCQNNWPEARAQREATWRRQLFEQLVKARPTSRLP